MTEEKKRKILEDEDFIDYPKSKYSLKLLIEKNPEGVSDDLIAKVLNISPEEVEEIYQNAINKLKKNLEIK